MSDTNPIIASFIREFSKTNDLIDLPESEQFEHLLSMLLFRKSIHERFATADVTTSKGETGIDGAAVVLDGNLILTAEDATHFFEKKKQSSSVIVEMLFFQGKLSKTFSRDQMLGFGEAIVGLLSTTPSEMPQDDYLTEIRGIYEVLLNNAAKLDLKQAVCKLSFCCLGEWQNPIHPALTLKKIKADLVELEFFGAVDVSPVDRNAIRDLWTDATRAQEASLPTQGDCATLGNVVYMGNRDCRQALWNSVVTGVAGSGA